MSFILGTIIVNNLIQLLYISLVVKLEEFKSNSLFLHSLERLKDDDIDKFSSKFSNIKP